MLRFIFTKIFDIIYIENEREVVIMFDDFDLGPQCEEYYNEAEYEAMMEEN